MGQATGRSRARARHGDDDNVWGALTPGWCAALIVAACLVAALLTAA